MAGDDSDRKLTINPRQSSRRKKAIGTNTAESTMAIPTSAPWICATSTFLSLLLAELLLNHYTFDVFHNHDGVIDQQAYRQHHAKHRQGVDGVPNIDSTAKVPNSTTGTAIVGMSVARMFCQKQIHDKKDEDNCLKERFKPLRGWIF